MDAGVSESVGVEMLATHSDIYEDPECAVEHTRVDPGARSRVDSNLLSIRTY